MSRFAWFDCLRCLAVFLVILAHAGNFSAGWWLPARALVQDAQLFSWAGIDLFFVMSGFLVSGLLFNEHDRTGGVDLRRFLVRRGFKIIPPFYALVALTAVYDAVVRGRVSGNHLLHDIFFLQSYRAGAWPHAWTLAVEVHFYLLLGLLLWRLARDKQNGKNWLRPLPTTLFWTLAACFICRLVNSSMRHGHFDWHREIVPSHLHMDVLAAGVLLRFIYQYHSPRLAGLTHSKLFWIALGVLLVSPSEFLWLPHPVIVTALIPVGNYLGFGLILFESTQLVFPVAGVWRWSVQPFDYLGKHSYSIYLWHLPVKDWLIDPFLKQSGALYFFSYFLASLLVGTVFSEALESPFLTLRNRLFPSAAETRVGKEKPFLAA